MPSRAPTLNERVTTLLDALAMLAVAAGVGLIVYGSPFGLPVLASGLTLGVLSLATQTLPAAAMAIRVARMRRQMARRDRQRPPGPEDAGTLHVMGG